MGLTCIVTVHGIGFQQAPDDTAEPPRPGYADGLHEALRTQLGSRLGDDPERGGHGPVYVQSSWDGVPAKGLARLTRRLVEPVDPAPDVAHVALVYAELEIPVGPRLGSSLDTLARAGLNLSHYAHPLSAMRMVLADALANLRHGSAANPPVPPSTEPSLKPVVLTPRSYDRPDLKEHDETFRAALSMPNLGDTPLPRDGAVGVVASLEQDVASYVCRNDLRESVRCFVADALAALSALEEVETIVLNTHSQGTVVAFDVLAGTALASLQSTNPAGKVRGLLTAGSPLRKYVELFAWGDAAGGVGQVVVTDDQWINVWDPHDPVADPLRGSSTWKRGTEPPSDTEPTLFRVMHADTNIHGVGSDCPVTDVQVDNVSVSTGGLRAHNYWGNPEFARILSKLVARAAPSP